MQQDKKTVTETHQKTVLPSFEVIDIIAVILVAGIVAMEVLSLEPSMEMWLLASASVGVKLQPMTKGLTSPAKPPPG